MFRLDQLYLGVQQWNPAQGTRGGTLTIEVTFCIGSGPWLVSSQMLHNWKPNLDSETHARPQFPDSASDPAAEGAEITSAVGTGTSACFLCSAVVVDVTTRFSSFPPVLLSFYNF